MNSTKLVEYDTCYYGLSIWMQSSPAAERIPFIAEINKIVADSLYEQEFHRLIVDTFHAQEGMDAMEFYTNGEIPFYDESI